MIYSYSRLWELSIDTRMTKMQMRKANGISMNDLARMGKTNLLQ